MNQPDEKYVYHGSRRRFELAVPKRQIRSRLRADGTQKIIFDQVSFHATPYRWIALAYTYNPKSYSLGGQTAHFNIGVSLYDYREELEIFGFESLEHSLAELYGDGGYLLSFDKRHFFHTAGLGDLEMITTNHLKPVWIERVADPVQELNRLGITYKFIDLARPENEAWRNYSPALQWSDDGK